MPGVESIVVSGDRFFKGYPIRNYMENMEQLRGVRFDTFDKKLKQKGGQDVLQKESAPGST